ncbi:MAG: aldehyde dehydrogenase [Actinobacteria bacterium]|nr:aldehyde dehydrogenase [Actinomycetota bacterium]
MDRTISAPDSTAVLGEIASTPAAEVADIVAAAADARHTWAALPVAARAAMLEAAADRLAGEAAELGPLLAAESGKPLAQAEFEVRASIGLLRGNATAGRRLGGRVLPTEGNAGTEWDLAYTRREPLGVVAAILPFNFPVELFVEKCAAALVVGNAVVVKLPLEDPLVVDRFHAALLDAGVPAPVLAAVHGDAAVGAALAGAPGVDAISLTGSTAAGIAVAEATAPRLRKLHLELGGNNACVVRADADLDLVAAEVIRGRLMMNGQACSATKRVLVHASRHDELAERLATALAAQRLGPATEPETTVGPLITPAAAARVADQVEGARGQGAELIAGDAIADGAYLAPCLLAAVPTGADVARDEEIFGPVITLIPVADDEEALAVANASSFGLMASVFSADERRAVALAERLEAGGVVINGSDNYRPPVIPFGGIKLSGTGREGLGYTIEELSREKTIVLRRFREPEPGA